MNFIFLMNSIAIGAGLAMDAFSVSLANGIQDPCMNTKKIAKMASIYAWFQFSMPMIGWFLVRGMLCFFSIVQYLLPWISFVVLGYLGFKMIQSARKTTSMNGLYCTPLSLRMILGQGFATSIDALSVGLMIAEYTFELAVISASIIAVVTFCLCFLSGHIGKQAGIRFAGKATLLGGTILILVGTQIFIRGIL